MDVPGVEAVLANLVTRYQSAFGGRSMSFYLIGSYADGSANDLSDIDLVAVCHGWVPGEADRAIQEGIHRAVGSPVRIDVGLIADEGLAASAVGVNVKLAGVLLAGDDIRAGIALPKLEVYQRNTAEAARHFMFTVLRNSHTTVTIEYPQPHDEFFGYAHKRITAWYPPSVAQGLKELVTTGTRIATALLALQVGAYVGTKAEAIHLYGAAIGGDWAELLAVLYAKGKQEWAYRVPDDAGNRALLRDLCANFLGLERHFLDVVP
jgi:hypothetical protein